MDPCIHGEEPLDQKNVDGRTTFQLYIVEYVHKILARNLNVTGDTTQWAIFVKIQTIADNYFNIADNYFTSFKLCILAKHL